MNQHLLHQHQRDGPLLQSHLQHSGFEIQTPVLPWEEPESDKVIFTFKEFLFQENHKILKHTSMLGMFYPVYLKKKIITIIIIIIIIIK